MSKCSDCSIKSCGSCNNNKHSMKQLKEMMKIKKMILESQTHDRNKCNCKGCWHYNIGFTIMQRGRFYFVIDGWKNMDRDEYLKAYQRILNYRLDKSTTEKKLRKFLKSKNAPENMIGQIIEQMQSSMFVVMFKTSPMGMMREI